MSITPTASLYVRYNAFFLVKINILSVRGWKLVKILGRRTGIKNNLSIGILESQSWNIHFIGKEIFHPPVPPLRRGGYRRGLFILFCWFMAPGIFRIYNPFSQKNLCKIKGKKFMVTKRF